MNLQLRVATTQAFAPALSKVLKIPHDLTIIGDQSDAEVANLLSDSDVLVFPEFRPAWKDPEGKGRLRLVHSTGAGVDGIDRASLPKGCTVCNCYGHEHALAETVFMDMLALQKNLLKLDAALRDGDWSEGLGLQKELSNRSLLVLGLGHAGKEIVRWGRFMGMKVTALTRSPSKDRAEEAGLRELGSLDELDSRLGDADFLVVAIPATAETVDLIGEKQFQLMKRTAFLINVGRAKVVNEEALYRALSTKRIAGAGLDVWYQYPEGSERQLPSRFPINELDNVIMTPHKATEETMAHRWAKIAENIGHLSRGEPLENVVYTT